MGCAINLPVMNLRHFMNLSSLKRMWNKTRVQCVNVWEGSGKSSSDHIWHLSISANRLRSLVPGSLDNATAGLINGFLNKNIHIYKDFQGELFWGHCIELSHCNSVILTKSRIYSIGYLEQHNLWPHTYFHSCRQIFQSQKLLHLLSESKCTLKGEALNTETGGFTKPWVCQHFCQNDILMLDTKDNWLLILNRILDLWITIHISKYRVKV